MSPGNPLDPSRPAPAPDLDRHLQALLLHLNNALAQGLDVLPLPGGKHGKAAESAAVEDRTEHLQNLAETVSQCTRCGLCRSRTQTVFGEGSPTPRLMFVGEGPGVEEDRSGRPFVGPAGQLLDRIIHAAQLRREDVYIANIIKCHPPGNRTPNPEEVHACLPYLHQQIRLLRPEIICPLGSPAAATLLESTQGITRLRGHQYTLPFDPEILVIPTFHPAYLLRYEREKGKTWSDVQRIMKHLGIALPNR